MIADVQPSAIVLATLVVSLVLFITDAVRYEVVALLIVLTLTLTGCLTPTDAFRGFSSPAVVLIGSMYVFGHAVTRWGVAEVLGQRVLARGTRSETMLAFRVCIVAGLFSALLSNTGVVAALIPVIAAVSRDTDVPASRLFMPLAFGSLLGGTTTLIGTSSNIAVQQTLLAQGADAGAAATELQRLGFSLFEFAPLGLILVGAGSLYFLGPGRRLLPRTRVDQTLSDHYQVRKFVTEVLVEPSSTLINRTVAEMDLFARYNITVLGIVRATAEDVTLAPGPYNRVRSDDTLILQGEPESIMRLRRDLGLRQVESIETAQARLASADVHLVEAVIPGDSSFVGSTLRDSDFRARTGLNVLAISKHGAVQLERLARTPLAMGDTLLIQGHIRDIERARRDRDLLVLDTLKTTPIGPGALFTLAMLFAVVASVAFLGTDLATAALCGAVGLILLGVVKPDAALRSVSWPVIILVGGMLALGDAFDRYDLDERVAHGMASLGSLTSSPHVMLGLVLVATTLLTQVVNNVAAAVIMTPVAQTFAAELGLDERAFVMSVIVGASLAFLTPVAHQANVMVAGPGDYRFKDYLRVGLPLTALALALALVFIPVFWPLE